MSLSDNWESVWVPDITGISTYLTVFWWGLMKIRNRRETELAYLTETDMQIVTGCYWVISQKLFSVLDLSLIQVENDSCWKIGSKPSFPSFFLLSLGNKCKQRTLLWKCQKTSMPPGFSDDTMQISAITEERVGNCYAQSSSQGRKLGMLS